MTATDTTDLISRLEEATEGSRELDIAVHKALGWELAPPEAGCAWWADDGRTQLEGPMPLYTTSIDAALTLVPEKWIPLSINWNDMSVGTYLRRGTMRDPGTPVHGGGRTPALSVCIAALRARNDMEK